MRSEGPGFSLIFIPGYHAQSLAEVDESKRHSLKSGERNLLKSVEIPFQKDLSKFCSALLELAFSKQRL
ncbi:MAG TPA: hypothetical protein VK177_21095 [Flavobacteriales bacterium]|nr:hypothetical protein [Flavobacteriales bacterium]